VIPPLKGGKRSNGDREGDVSWRSEWSSVLAAFFTTKTQRHQDKFEDARHEIHTEENSDVY